MATQGIRNLFLQRFVGAIVDNSRQKLFIEVKQPTIKILQKIQQQNIKINSVKQIQTIKPMIKRAVIHPSNKIQIIQPPIKIKQIQTQEPHIESIKSQTMPDLGKIKILLSDLAVMIIEWISTEKPIFVNRSGITQTTIIKLTIE